MNQTDKLDQARLNNPLRAAQCLFRGLQLLFTPAFRPFVWIPIGVNLLLYSAAFFLGLHYLSAFLDAVIPDWLEWLDWLLLPLVGLAFVLLTFSTFSLMANLIACPFYGKLAEKAQKELLGVAGDRGDNGLKEVLAIVGSELGRLGYYFSRVAVLGVLFLLPGLNVVATLLWVLFSAWFLALEYTSYWMELYGIRFRQQRDRLKRSRFGILAFGGLVLAGMAVPVLNILVPPAAVIGAVLYCGVGTQRT